MMFSYRVDVYRPDAAKPGLAELAFPKQLTRFEGLYREEDIYE